MGCCVYVGKFGGEKENYFIWVEDLVKGEYKFFWDSSIWVCDGWKYYFDGVKLGLMFKNGIIVVKLVELVMV